MQEKYDCEIYSIIDVEDKARKFFAEQNLVNFKKSWYYMDYIKNSQQYDINYLSNVETKYKINLWSIAYSDREFYKYNQFYKFNENEILSIIEQECKFYEAVLDEIDPDFLCMMIATVQHQQLLYEICKARGVKVLMFSAIQFANRVMISDDVTRIDEDSKNDSYIPKTMTSEELQNYLKRYDSYKQIDVMKNIGFESHTWQRYNAILKFILSGRTKNYKNRYFNYGKTRLRYITVKISNFLNKKYRTYFINKNFKRTFEEKRPFVYFPLHFEPERVLLIDAQFYTNQISIIENIAKSLPVGYELYVKEHPAMKIVGWRNILFYKQIMKLPNAKLIHPSVSSEELIKKCSLVTTIAGTTAQEAAFYKKPALVFTEQIFSSISSIYKLKKIEELPDVIRSLLNKDVDTSSLEKFIDLIDKNTFEFDIVSISADFAYRFGLKGLIMDAELPLPKVKSFLDDYRLAFEQLTREHIKQIQKYKLNSKEHEL